MDERPWHAFYEDGVPVSIDYEDITVHGLLDRAVDRYPDQPAIRFQNKTLTYRQLDDEVNRLATALAGFGVTKDTRVAIQLPNIPQTVIAYFATLRLGGVVVMTNPLYMPPEIEHQWQDSGATVAIVLDALYKSKIEPIRDKLPIKHFVVASIPEYLGFPLNFLAPIKLKKADPPMIASVMETDTVHRFRALIKRTKPNAPGVTVGMDDVAMLQYTGGTTGVSKGAILTHRNVSANVEQCVRINPRMEYGTEIGICCLPLFHIYGITVSMLLGVSVGGLTVLIPNPRDIGSIIKAITKNRATMCPMVPAMYIGFNAFPGIESMDFSSLKFCNSGSAPLPVDVMMRFEELTGARITEGYGLSETSPVTHSNPIYGTRKPGSIGLPLSDTDTRIVDVEDGETEKALGEEGELLLRGPQVFPGYWNRPDETAKALRNGWFHTGDLATMDEDGFHYIVGRKKDMILASGYNIYPDEIDRMLMGHDDILEAATIGVPDDKRGETVKSFVVLAPGATLTAEDVIDYARENVAAYKIPRAVEFRDSLPKSTVLKILRRELRDEEMRKREQSG